MRTLVLFIALGISTPAMAFEGEIVAKGVGEAGTGLAAMKILVSKNGDVSMEITAKDSSGAPKKVGYLNPAKGKYNYMLEHSKKTAIKMPKEMYDKMTKSSQVNKVVEDQNVEIKKLGKEKIAGHMTRHIQVIDKDTGGVSDMWMSDKYSAQLWSRVFAFGSQGPTDQMKDWNQAAKKIGFKPGFIMKDGAQGPRREGRRLGGDQADGEEDRQGASFAARRLRRRRDAHAPRRGGRQLDEGPHHARRSGENARGVDKEDGALSCS